MGVISASLKEAGKWPTVNISVKRFRPISILDLCMSKSFNMSSNPQAFLACSLSSFVSSSFGLLGNLVLLLRMN